MEKFIKLSKELEEKVNYLLEKMWYWWEFWLVWADNKWYIIYAESICFRI